MRILSFHRLLERKVLYVMGKRGDYQNYYTTHSGNARYMRADITELQEVHDNWIGHNDDP